MFRRIYWVIERVYAGGRSQVEGVYTSIPNLVRHALDRETTGRIRLTLVKLDSNQEPLGCWLEPDFQDLYQDLMPFVRTDEFSAEQCQALVDHLSARGESGVTARAA